METIEHICSPLVDALNLIANERLSTHSASITASLAIDNYQKSLGTAM